ncbi:hypothetical protein [Enterococcus faecium]|uniref:hypothetical protein n=1 Tax=Enterococcus faecium TaxID=1352 RepID=UPI000BF0D96F|nr:hypothetical protein [Enterococcus faecium]PEH49576.1 hypothetical protein CRM75_01315 [Enterococcus faecium]
MKKKKKVNENYLFNLVILLFVFLLAGTAKTAICYRDQTEEITIELNREKENLEQSKEINKELIKENKIIASEKEKFKQQENTMEKAAANAAKDNQLLERQVNEQGAKAYE